ncbi:hypothetical protein E2C01_031033 [Portunus trituberculatus]|uniref:Uncharacterized protein n=1 Tax=Portunus trituberculatus TaxID=210409 RepID=A0A5B7EWJ2_PORTR|nr:hypothetical protein [Portunus trituberculatus]
MDKGSRRTDERYHGVVKKQTPIFFSIFSRDGGEQGTGRGELRGAGSVAVWQSGSPSSGLSRVKGRRYWSNGVHWDVGYMRGKRQGRLLQEKI